MLKCVEKLVNATNDTRYGSHRVEILSDNGDIIKKFYYHESPICIVNESQKCCILDNCKWNTISTNRALSSYRQAYKDDYAIFDVSDYGD